MANQPITFSRLLKASPAKVWKAITDRDEMKQSYQPGRFKAEKGFRFQFCTGGPSIEKQYVHLVRLRK